LWSRAEEELLANEEDPTKRRLTVKEALKMKSDSYPREYAKVLTAITEAEAAGKLNTGDQWVKCRNGNWFPPIDEEVLTEVADWYLLNTELAQLHNVKSIVNHYYKAAFGTAPWNKSFSRLMTKYEHAQFLDSVKRQELDKAAGKEPKLKRAPCSEDDFQRLVITGRGAVGDHLGEIATTEIMALCGLRASSSKLGNGSKASLKKAVIFSESGWLIVIVTFLKGKDLIDEIVRVPPGPADEPEHPRNVIFATIKRALETDGLYVPTGHVSAASVKITALLRNKLFKDAVFKTGFGISSHSMREFMASAAFKAGASREKGSKLLTHGFWGSEAAIKAYIFEDFVITDFSKKLFDFLIE
jgi:hypothetical protein